MTLKIIIINYRYFISGGPERYLFNIKDLLESKGHTVIPFSVKSRFNKPSEYEKYFLSPIGEGKEVYFSEYKKSNVKTILRSFARMFYSFEAKRKLGKLIKETNPDLVYVLHYQNKISSSIFDAAVKNNIPVVHRVSDYGLICANGIFYRQRKKDICERCLEGSKMNAVINRCVYNSYIYSAIKTASLQFQQFLGLTKKIKAFVVPSRFTISKLKQFGIPQEKLFHIPTFFNFGLLEDSHEISHEPFALFIGRVEEEKGLLTLLKAFENTDFSLKIIGSSSTGFDTELKQRLENKKHKIEFLGQKNFNEIQSYLSRCAFTVMPTEVYDNFPNTILESYAFRKCVVATDTGSLREIVEDNETGLLFPIKDAESLRSKIQYLFDNRKTCIEFGEKAYKKLTEEFSAENHYASLLKVFNSVITGKGKVKISGREFINQ